MTDLDRLEAVTSERWHQLKAAEKLNRELESHLRKMVFIAESGREKLPDRLRTEIRQAKELLQNIRTARGEKKARRN